jgi:hypothetical protein
VTCGRLARDLGGGAASAWRYQEVSPTGFEPCPSQDYGRPALDKQRLGELIDLVGTISLGDKASRSKDILGRVYEYFLSQFASAEGKKGGQFYTPQFGPRPGRDAGPLQSPRLRSLRRLVWPVLRVGHVVFLFHHVNRNVLPFSSFSYFFRP